MKLFLRGPLSRMLSANYDFTGSCPAPRMSKNLNSEKALFMSTVENYISGAPFRTEQFNRTLEMIEQFRRFGFNDVYYIPVTTQGDSGNAMFAMAVKPALQHGRHVAGPT